MTVTQNPTAPLVVVVAATSRQGSSVVKNLIASDRPYRLRGFTSDITRPAALALEAQGVELIQTALVVPQDKDVARKAFEGADFVFGVTNYWAHLDKQKEIDQGKMIVDATKAANVPILIFSSLANATKLSGGKYTRADHVDSAAAIAQYAKDIGVPLIEVQPGLYVENYVANYADSHLMTKQPDGSFLLQLPVDENTLISPFIHTAADYGLWVRRAIEEALPAGTCLHAFAEGITVAQVVEQFQQVTGKKLVYKQFTHEQFIDFYTRAFAQAPNPIDHAQQMLEMYLFFEEFGYYGQGTPTPDLEGLARTPGTWADYVRATDWDSL